ncbi:sacsin N-terminal ATP-binding-like domain-containing protein [Cellulomonas soli]|uniref:sacsin N-terminal ATP-binding-like domain-containing protein n=1 Tax=Cellulomonas soli TaxID=931535 RepID=UPI003F83B209
MSPDVFGTADLRAAVLEAWRLSPARLREDANLEEDHARGYYRDRVLVELAQNASDAAVRAGVPGRLLLRLTHATDGPEDGSRHVAGDRSGGPVLVAANTGAPLDVAGVASLASMRASAKWPGTAHRTDAGAPHGGAVVGRFGVGFAAVRAVSDDVSVLSTTGGVRFSLADARALLDQAGAQDRVLAEEVHRRDGSLPALRLPLPADGRPPSGYDTAVVLRLRDEVAADEVRALLAEVGDPLLLGLPGLVEIVVEDLTSDAPGRRVADAASRWHVASGQGELAAHLLADRPVEERGSRSWRVTWAVPRAGVDVGWDPVVHAPTPTDEDCTVPALLIATVPLDPSRRHVAAGPATDAVLDHAADVLAELAQELAREGGDPLSLVPTGFAAGTLDGSLRARVVARLARTPLLPTHDPADEGGFVAPDRAVAVAGAVGRDEGAVEALAHAVADLVRVPPGRETEARVLGVEVRPLADVVEQLPTDPAVPWARLYAALAAADADPQVREALGGLPVPLVDGRVVRGVRGTVLLAADVVDRVGARALALLGRWGLRVVDPAAADPLLGRLGADETGAAGLLGNPAVRAAVLAQADDDDLELADEVTDAVLALVAAVLHDDDPEDGAQAAEGRLAVPTLEPGVAAWLGLLTLPAADGEPTPAHGLVLPGSPAAQLLDHRVLAPVALETVERWGARALVTAGVRQDLVLVALPDQVADADALDPDATDAAALAAQQLDGWPEYLDDLAVRLGAGEYVGDLVAVADLDAVDVDAWPRVLHRIASTTALRDALLVPVRAERGGHAPSYTQWWVRTRSGAVPDGPFAVDGAAAVLAATLPGAPPALAGLDVQVQRALGGVAETTELDADGWTAVLGGLGRVGSAVEVRTAVAVWRGLAGWSVASHAGDGKGPQPGAATDWAPATVPALVGPGRVAVVRAEDAAVADAPFWWQRTDVAAMVPAVDPGRAAALAAFLDVPHAADLAEGLVDAQGALVDVPPEVRALLPGAPDRWYEHEDLTVDGAPVDWWVLGSGADAQVHATTVSGLAAGLAWAVGGWTLRHAVEQVLTDPDRAVEVQLDGLHTPDEGGC